MVVNFKRPLMLCRQPTNGEHDAESREFDRDVRRALFHRARERVQNEVQESTWEAFWQTAVLGKTAAETAAKLGMTVGAVRVARCRVLARVRAEIAEWEEVK